MFNGIGTSSFKFNFTGVILLGRIGVGSIIYYYVKYIYNGGVLSFSMFLDSLSKWKAGANLSVFWRSGNDPTGIFLGDSL
jgi:hypothetical protein